MTERFCKDCRHYRSGKTTHFAGVLGGYVLSFDSCEATAVKDPVSGEPIRVRVDPRERNAGLDCKMFEAKETP